MATTKSFKKTKPKRVRNRIVGTVLFHIFFIAILLVIVAIVVYGIFIDSDLTNVAKINPNIVTVIQRLTERLHLFLGFSSTQFGGTLLANPLTRIGILETIGLLVVVFGSVYFLLLPLVIKSHNKRVNKVRYDRKRFWSVILFILNLFACIYVAFVVSYLLIASNDGFYASNDSYLPNMEAIKDKNFLYQGAYFVTYSYRAMLDFVFNIETIRNVPGSSFIFPGFTTANASAVVILFIAWFTFNIFSNIFLVSGPKEKSSSLKVFSSLYPTVLDEYVDEKEFNKDLRTEDTMLLTDSKEQLPQISDQGIKELENKISGNAPIDEKEVEEIPDDTVTDARPEEEKEPEIQTEIEPEPEAQEPINIPEPEPEPEPAPEPKKKAKKTPVNYVVYRDSIPSVEETQSKTGVTNREKKVLDELEPTTLSSAPLDGIYKEDVNKILGELEPQKGETVELPELSEEEEYLDFENSEQEVDVLPGIDEVSSKPWEDNEYPLGDEEAKDDIEPAPINKEEQENKPIEEIVPEQASDDEVLEDVVVDLEKVEDTQPVIEDVSSFIIDEETPVIELDTDTVPIEDEVEEKEPSEVKKEEKKEPDIVQVKSFAPEEIKEKEEKEPDIVQVKTFEPEEIKAKEEVKEEGIIPEYVEQPSIPIHDVEEEKEPEVVIEEPEIKTPVHEEVVEEVVEEKEEKPKITPVTPFVMDEPVPPVHEEEVPMPRIVRPMHEITSISKKRTEKVKPKRVAFELSAYNIKTYSGELTPEEAFASSAIKVKPIAQPVFKNSKTLPSWKAKKEREDIRKNGYANVTQNNTSFSKEGAIIKPVGVSYAGAKSIKDMLKVNKNLDQPKVPAKPVKPFTPPVVTMAEAKKRLEKEKLVKESENKKEEKLAPKEVPNPSTTKAQASATRPANKIKPVAPTKPVAPIKPVKKRRK